MSDQLGVAIIGCGYWGVNYVRVFNELSGSKVAIVCDRSKRRLDQVHDLFPWVNSTTETNEIFESKDIDAVVVCSEASNHFDITWKALNHGKHVLVEKPITTKASEALELVTLSEARKLTLMVGHTFIYNPAVKKLKSLIDSSDLGSVYYLYARRTNLGPVRKDVNALWDLAPHDVSIFSYLLDEMPSWVSAVGMRVLRNGREDVGFITLGYASGVVANIHVSWADPSKVRELVAVGSEKRVVFNDLDPSEKVRIFEKGISTVEKGPDSTYGEQSLQIRDGDIISPHIDASEPLKNQCSHFLKCIKENAIPGTPGQAGLDVVRVMEAVTESVSLNGTPVQISGESENVKNVTNRISAIR